MNQPKFDIPKEYKLIKGENLKDIDTNGYLMVHIKSGARIAVMENNDDNKVFYIAFRTAPKDSTGVAHILEHSVLCGSKKYPIKDPFVELAKGSLNTFLNAMTYPDKTVYPIASQNHKDFKNLMDVYMDAVLNPRIYDDNKIFRQEGWHYEIDEDDRLVYNGVVYNEMKGAFSSPDDVLNREILNSLFPGNTYDFESGGDPVNIPDLTYEDFLAFHKRYYHPSNSFIYLYGDLDMTERLKFLDREYLSHYDRIEPKTDINLQEPFETQRRTDRAYPVISAKEEKEGVYYSLNYVVDNILNQELYLAFSVLDYALLNSPGAPLREALMKKGIGKDVIGGYQNGTYQPYFSIGIKGAKKSDENRFLRTVSNALKEISETGIDKKSLYAAINMQEFSFREADFGPYPKGLIYGLICMDSWNYSDSMPFTHLAAIPVFNKLKKMVETDYFEKLVEKYLINNNHSSFVVLSPKAGLAKEQESELQNRLSAYRESLSDEEVEEIKSESRKLLEFQAEPTPPEELAKLPALGIEDLDKNIRPIKNRIVTEKSTRVVYHDINSNGITYLGLMFDIGDIPLEDISKVSFIIKMMGLLSTKNYSYKELSNEINIQTGGIYSHIQNFSNNDDSLSFYCVIGSKFLKDSTENALRLMLEMMFDTEYEDNSRIRELLNQELQNFKMRAGASGHTLAAGRAQAMFSEEYHVSEHLNGIKFYEFLNNLNDNFKDKIEEFKEDCKRLIPLIFRKSGLIVSVTGDTKQTKVVGEYINLLEDRCSDNKMLTKVSYGTLNRERAGFKTSSSVQYVSRAGNFKRTGLPYTGTLKVLKTILSYEYFWTNIRVVGGAYGCMAGFKRNGDMYFVSYRDPNLSKTKEVFDKTPDFLKTFDCDNKTMVKYIIGTISNMDMPLTPSAEGERSMNCLLAGITEDMLREERNAVLNAGKADINNLCERVDVALKENILCVLGSEASIEAESELFDAITALV